MAASESSKAATVRVRDRSISAASDAKAETRNLFPMSTVTTGALLIIFLPFLLSLFGQGSQAKMLCLTSSILGLLLSVEQYGAVMPWVLGMIVATVSLWERIRLRRMA